MIKKILKTTLLVLAIILIGTGLDYLVHNSRAEFAVPAFYFPDKIIFGTIWGGLIYWGISRRIKNHYLAPLSLAALVAVILQIRYLLLGYPLSFVLIFLGVHLVAFYVPAQLLWRYFK